jgi:hypothetical protein
MEYTTTSLMLYRDQCALRPVLTASKEYLEGTDAEKNTFQSGPPGEPARVA